MTKVEHLKKITLTIRAGTSSGRMDLIPKHPEFEFIFGLAPEGMTPFEYELAGKAAGEEILLHLKIETLNKFFEHLIPPIGDLFDGRDDVYLKVKIREISAADNREIVRALAAAAAHGGGGCSCGCGCG
jgi:hypothetical protein